jgi:hypothetical protein
MSGAQFDPKLVSPEASRFLFEHKPYIISEDDIDIMSEDDIDIIDRQIQEFRIDNVDDHLNKY